DLGAALVGRPAARRGDHVATELAQRGDVGDVLLGRRDRVRLRAVPGERAGALPGGLEEGDREVAGARLVRDRGQRVAGPRLEVGRVEVGRERLWGHRRRGGGDRRGETGGKSDRGGRGRETSETTSHAETSPVGSAGRDPPGHRAVRRVYARPPRPARRVV